MNGGSYNNSMKILKKQDGQILLIVVMLFALSLTIVMSVSFKSITESQITKLEEESQRALAAAEAGVEAALKSSETGVKSFSELGIPSLEGIQAGSVTIASVQLTTFTTPIVVADDTYTFYMADYDTETGVFGSSYGGAQLSIYYGQQNGDCSQTALELTFISGASPYTTTRYLADIGSLVSVASSSDKVGVSLGSAETTIDPTVPFWCGISAISRPTNAKLLLIRVIGKGTRIGFKGSENLKLQGKTITSEAQSTGGVKKKIYFFQSYSQIPASLYTTIFNNIN